MEQRPQVPLAQAQLIEECTKQLPIFKAAKVCLVIKMVVLPQGFIPPYLYFEEKPTESILWTSDYTDSDRKSVQGHVESEILTL